jgi:protoporphyrinogen oxidase
MNISHKTEVAIIGGGFTGLTAAYELAKQGISVTILEAASEIGGLAAAFDVGDEKLDCFYHHWFTNDYEVMNLINELNLNNRVVINPTNTGIYYANNFFKLSTPWDLLNFTPLNFFDRIRLGLLALRARMVKDWRELENKTAQEWLCEIGGENVYKVVWEPLLKGKFGNYAAEVSAVWFWNKLKLRGGSRGNGGEERLAYFKGGFAALADALANKIISLGGRIEFNSPVNEILSIPKNWEVKTVNGVINAKNVIATIALPLVAEMIESWALPSYINSLKRIQYIGNLCLVLELDRPLSDIYWLNVNDPSFPFVGIIEHTNFECPTTYGGRHIVYLSKYLPHTDNLYSMNANEFLDYAIPYLKIMFPSFDSSWIKQHHLWKARWSQPVVERCYSALIPKSKGPKKGFHLCSMAQIYPEDRGTNYAIREGRKMGAELAKEIKENLNKKI